MKLGSTRSARSGKARFLAVLLLAFAIAFGAWYAFRIGPVPEVNLVTERPAVGRSNEVTAVFSQPELGLGRVRLELIQGDRTELLAEEVLVPGSGIPLFGGVGTAQVVLEATVGTDAMAWLAEGEVVLRATADRTSGPLRSAEPVSVERTLPVRLRLPRLEVVSTQHYGRQGGSGAVVYRVGEHVVRSGVRAGQMESPGSPRPGGGTTDRFTFYSLPWNVADSSEIRLFAEDDAGNRAEQPFLDIFKAMPSRTDTIRLSDAFLKKVVPAIASQTPGFDASGSLLSHLPDTNMLDELTHQMVMFGFLFLTVGIITGAVWANSAWGRYWGWDPKETWSLITWFVYATALHARLMRGWHGKRIAILSIAGFLAVLFTYFGVNYLPGLHSYGSMGL